ncbi:hypothetical protein EBZ39_05630, partial [bacterium]|nr:hypothetical protein [bacterium]
MLNTSKSRNHVKWYIALLFGQIACQLLAETGQTILLPHAPDAFGVQQQQSASWPEVFAKTKQSVVQIFCFSSPFSFQTPFKTGDLQQCRGSGFFVQLGGQL